MIGCQEGLLSILGGGARPTAQDEEFALFEQYMRQENGKGTILACQKFVGDYDLFGTGISKIADLASNNVDVITTLIPFPGSQLELGAVCRVCWAGGRRSAMRW